MTARTVIAFWWLFSIVAGGIYTGNLVAIRMTTGPGSTIFTVNDLLARADYRWGVEGGDYLTVILQNSPVAKFRDLWSGIERFKQTDPRVLSRNYSMQLETVNRGYYAYFNDKSFLEVEMSKNCDELHIASENILTMQFAIGLHKNSTLRRLFSHQIMAFHEAGIISAWKGRWWPYSKCFGQKKSVASSVVFNEVLGAYYILGGFLFIAFVTFLVEIWIHKLRKLCFRQLRKIGETTEKLH